jgi:hypothetical protein
MPDEEALEVVLETIDPTEVAIVKSLLESAGIPYLTRGDDQYDAFRGAFRGTVFNPGGRPVVFLFPPVGQKKHACCCNTDSFLP